MDNFFVENKIEDRKLTLYAEAANYEYQFSLEDALLYSTSIEEYNMMCEDAEDKMQKASGNFFTRLFDSIAKFFSRLIEKISSFFQKKETDKLKLTIDGSAEIRTRKVEVPDVMTIKKACEDDVKLCERLVKKQIAGTLTQEEFDRELGKAYVNRMKHQKVKKIVTTVGKVTLVLGGVAAASAVVITAQKKLNAMIESLKKSKEEKMKKAEAVKNAPKQIVNKGKEMTEKVVTSVETVAGNVTSTVKEAAENYQQKVQEATIAVKNAVDGSSAVIDKINNHPVTVNGKAYSNIDSAISDLNKQGKTSEAKKLEDARDTKIDKAKDAGKKNGLLKNFTNAVTGKGTPSEKRLNSSISDGSNRALSAEEISDIQSKLHVLDKSVNRNQPIDFTVNGKKVHYKNLGKAISQLAKVDKKYPRVN